MKDMKPDANDDSREQLTAFKANASAQRRFDGLMKRLSHINAGGKFSRDDMTSSTAESSNISK
jgi:hypothetical protein